MATGERTISFFRVMAYKSPTANVPMEDADWYEVLTFLSKQPLEKRTSNVGGRILIGEILFYEERAHLKLLKVRDIEAWLGIYNDNEKSVQDIQLDETNQLYETSIVSFLEFGNILGLIQGSTSAPTASAVVEWLEALGVFGQDVHLAVEAVLSSEARRKLTRAPEASRIETRISTTKAQALEARGSRLSGILRKVNEEFGPITVTLILQASRAKENTETRQILRAEAESLAAAADENDLGKAKARLLYYDAEDNASTQNVDFIRQRITAKRKIGSFDDEGQPIRNESAVKAILQVVAEHESELRAAVDRPAT
ncbi:hypothetical protein [Rhodococcus sp. B50]|uniref:hypothetical protein n=1 Tax=Rhodococcus sp. B50 TaxID=2682847 RepID=UPI001BD533A4|nr:hypothetical protein [Rhodococcus sp. B50]MBS9371578.1 hypothetical protein [Rhodococcus sp. B50]